MLVSRSEDTQIIDDLRKEIDSLQSYVSEHTTPSMLTLMSRTWLQRCIIEACRRLAAALAGGSRASKRPQSAREARRARDTRQLRRAARYQHRPVVQDAAVRRVRRDDSRFRHGGDRRGSTSARGRVLAAGPVRLQAGARWRFVARRLHSVSLACVVPHVALAEQTIANCHRPSRRLQRHRRKPTEARALR